MEKHYTKSESDLIHEGLHGKLDLILDQTTRHNGRLTRLERFMWTLGGGMGILSLIQFEKIINLFS